MKFVLKFSEIGMKDLPKVGGKNASLGEMYNTLTNKGIRVPDGFAVTTTGYQHFLSVNDLDEIISTELKGIDINNIRTLQEAGLRIRSAVLRGSFSEDLRTEILSSYHKLGKHTDAPISVAIRSSATSEDLPDASFAGQQESYLNVHGEEAVLDACKRCFASLFTDRAISYREKRRIEHSKVGLSIGIQQMVRADLGLSGVMFTLDTETGFNDLIQINASYGLGESIVQGAITPDEALIFKPTLKEGYKPIVSKKVGSKEFKVVFDAGGTRGTCTEAVDLHERRRFCVKDRDLLTLAEWGCIIEDHYSALRNVSTPMDIEWAKDGITGDLFIVQARPETVHSRSDKRTIVRYKLLNEAKVLLSGQSVGEKIADGNVRIIDSVKEISLLKEGEILVTGRTDPDWEPVMKKAAAIITDHGGRTCHAAIVSRELGVPAIVGTGDATKILRTGQEVTVSCAEGETGYVYEGKVGYEKEVIDIQETVPLRTQVMINLADPNQALKLSFLPSDGVGLARMEFVISNLIRVHPVALIEYQNIKDEKVKARIDELTFQYKDKKSYFIEKLAEAIGTIAAAFYPRDVILRFSDFKTNEYRHLIGGDLFEPVESNPMLGFRGASRYYDPRYRQAFALECAAVRKIREEFGLRNLKVMIPFCRTIEEGKRVIEELRLNNLVRGKDGLKVYLMCEIPSNVIMAEEFCEYFDGFSIGSNDLTQLILGVDRDSEEVSHLFNERDLAVKRCIANVVRTVRGKGKKIGICGQAPSDYPEFLEFLVEEKIDSISLNPDSVLKLRKLIEKFEQKTD